GRGAYGVQSAARTYFGVDAKDLDWGQAAMLVALIRNPTGYDPIRFPEVARQRRQVVLSVVADQQLLPKNQAELYQQVELPTEVRERSVVSSAADLTYFERKVRDELLRSSWLAPTPELRKYLVFNGGLKVTTTYDPRAQELAEAAARTNPLKRANPETQAVVASVEPATGAVRAVVGEVSTPKGTIVEVADSKVGRSPGSSFKTFTFAAAMEAGYSVNDVVSANPAPARLYPGWGVEGPSWPAECNGGALPLITALAKSNNCAFVRLQQAVGSDKVVDVARRLGITTVQSPRDEVPSLTLGGVSVRPLEMAAAYAAIANDGRYNPPHFITKVVDGKGKVIYEYAPPNTQAISVQSARETTTALQQVVRAGTYAAGALPEGRPAAGKTGTNEQDSGANTDVWFVGFTPEMATAVWIGNPGAVTNMRGGKVQGGSTSARVWRAFMAPYLEGRPVVKFAAADPIKGKGTVKDPWGGETAPIVGSASVPGAGSERSTTTTAGSSPTTSPPATSPPTTAAPAPSPEPAPGAG
ncbi:MAG: transglycosylase domain-containing protein, partial [Actinomycetes bacterium]